MIGWRWVCYPKYILINNFIAVTTFHTLHNLLQFIIFEQVTLYFCLLHLIYCIVGITLCCFVSHMPLFFGCVSQLDCHQHTPSVSFCLHDLDVFAEDFEQVIISFISSALFANWIKICSTSAAHTIGVILWCVGWLWTGHCSNFLFSGIIVI